MSYPAQFTVLKKGVNPLHKLIIDGKIRVGERTDADKAKINGYFRLADSADEHEWHFRAMFGDQPRSIPIYFPTSSLEIIQKHQLEAWENKRELGYGDGEMYMIYDPVKKEKVLTERGSELYNRVPKKLWSEQLTLRFKIPNMPGGGFYLLKTGGASSSIPKILNSLRYVHQIMGGHLDHMLFFLQTSIATGKDPGDFRKYAVIKLTSAYTPEQMMKIQKGFVSGELKKEEIISYAQYGEYLLSKGEKLLPTHEKLIELAVGKLSPFELKNHIEQPEAVIPINQEIENPNQRVMNFENPEE